MWSIRWRGFGSGSIPFFASTLLAPTLGGGLVSERGAGLREEGRSEEMEEEEEEVGGVLLLVVVEEATPSFCPIEFTPLPFPMSDGTP